MGCWTDIKKQKPPLNIEVLIFCQGYSLTPKHIYWSDYKLAVYVVNPHDKRKKAFVQSLDYRVAQIYQTKGEGLSLRDAWIYHDVTHWMHLPKQPLKRELELERARI